MNGYRSLSHLFCLGSGFATEPDAGFKVIEAVHADEALRVLKAVSGIDAVVTDVEMPRGSINGFELARRVRSDRQEIRGVDRLGASRSEARRPAGWGAVHRQARPPRDARAVAQGTSRRSPGMMAEVAI
jgi:CheY-like chemotaxis protein